MVDQTQVKKLTPGDIRGVFLRSNLFQGSWNFERMQALGFCFCMVPVIRRLYPENNDDRKQAIKRHLEFFNTHPYVAAPVLGVTLAMEEQRANGAPIDDAAINGLKVGLMGPLAGVGDPIFWGTVRPVFAALGAGIAACLARCCSSSCSTWFACLTVITAWHTATRKGSISLAIWAAASCKN
jgi:PTS system mannose-specific IID component